MLQILKVSNHPDMEYKTPIQSVGQDKVMMPCLIPEYSVICRERTVYKWYLDTFICPKLATASNTLDKNVILKNQNDVCKLFYSLFIYLKSRWWGIEEKFMFSNLSLWHL